jgi:hypothetical protein
MMVATFSLVVSPLDVDSTKNIEVETPVNAPNHNSLGHSFMVNS